MTTCADIKEEYQKELTVFAQCSDEVDDAYESGGVPVVGTTAGEDDGRIVMDGLGVSMAPGQDEGHNSETVVAHSDVTVDGISDPRCFGVSMAPGQDEFVKQCGDGCVF